MTQPLQNFALRVGAPRYVLLAGGIGITALTAMASALRRLKADYTLVYVGRSRSVMAHLQALREEHGAALRVHVDDEGTGLDAAALVDEQAQAAPGTELYMCGPIRLMDVVRRRWNDAGLPPTDLRYETFGNSGWFDAEEFVVSIPRLGIEATVGADRSMLEALEQAGADLMFDCRKGECGLCQVTILRAEGTVDHRDVFFDDEQKATSQKMCTCVSRLVRGDGSGAVLTIDVP